MLEMAGVFLGQLPRAFAGFRPEQGLEISAKRSARSRSLRRRIGTQIEPMRRYTSQPVCYIRQHLDRRSPKLMGAQFNELILTHS